MANLKKPLPIFHKSKIYEIDLDYDKPLVEPTAGDQVSAGSKPGDKKDDNVKDKKKDESDDDDEESDSDGKKKKEEEQRSPLKLIIDLNEDIHSMSSSGDYIVLLTTNNYNTKQLTILKRTSPASKPSVIAKLQAAKDSSVVHFDGRLLALFDDAARLFDRRAPRPAAPVAGPRLRSPLPEDHKPRATADKYGYLQDNIIYVRRISDNEILYQFDTRKIAAAYDMERVTELQICCSPTDMMHVLVAVYYIDDKMSVHDERQQQLLAIRR
jgi:hypothetical protein